ncbi:polyprenol monophosphomannose synthase [Nocardioides marmorisolisilvae]|uniref:polyprenol monophosphomannose synthase n=1 Tax=Nocardioides marmorisolisilvae TaxID=1542737 RepID=UPI001FEC5FC1|nr:polyprenol monophosphomannose synthase [Nocardioides marmorisolisilvae]
MASIVVIPTYDEAESVLEALDRVLAATDAHVLVVDDSSPDGTADLVRAHAAFTDRVFLLERPGKAGLGAAYRAGFSWARERGYAVIGQMDADLSHPPEALAGMLAASRGNGGSADLVIGSRYVPGGGTENWPLSRRVISRGGNLYVRVVLRVPVRDATAGFRVWAADALEICHVAQSQSTGYAFQVENTWRAQRAGLAIEEYPITFTERRLGQSKMTATIAREAMVRVLVWRVNEIRQRLRTTARRLLRRR